MFTQRHITRREILGAAWAGAAGVAAGTILQGSARQTGLGPHAATADPQIRGPFPILSTPFTASGAVDFDVLANQARFVDWGGCPGMIWPQSGDSVDLLTTNEKLQGMEVLATAARGLRTALCLGVQGKDTAEMLVFARHAERLAPAAIISRPPDAGRTEDALRQYWRTLAGVAQRPVIIQTTGGVAYKGPVPSLQLLIELAQEFPHFGYIKEEAGPVITRTRALLAARPPIRRVFSARGGLGWLYESRLGTEGLITERAVYADVLTRIWELQQGGSDLFGAGVDRGGHRRDRLPVRGIEAVPEAGLTPLCSESVNRVNACCGKGVRMCSIGSSRLSEQGLLFQAANQTHRSTTPTVGLRAQRRPDGRGIQLPRSVGCQFKFQPVAAQARTALTRRSVGSPGQGISTPRCWFQRGAGRSC